MPASGGVDLYGTSYRNFASALYADIRREAFGDDIGQTGWLTAEEQDLFIAWLGLSRASHLLDVACGSGRPALRIAQKTDCRVSGVDLHDEGIASAKANAKEMGCEERADFAFTHSGLTQELDRVLSEPWRRMADRRGTGAPCLGDAE